MCADFNLKEEERSEFSPAYTASNNAAEKIREVVVNTIGKPFFESSVTTALLEILLIQTRGEGKAHTFLYDVENSKLKDSLDEAYFKASIDAIFDDQGFATLSVIDELYFEKMIWIGEMSNDGWKSCGNNDGNIVWHKEYKRNLRKDYIETGKGMTAQEAMEAAPRKAADAARAKVAKESGTSQKAAEEAGKSAEKAARAIIKKANNNGIKTYKILFKQYGEKLFSFFDKSKYFYILLIPVALSNENKDHQEKIGAVFLHIGATKEIEPETLLDVYKEVILYWHYHLTGQVLEKRRRAEERSSGRALLYDSIKGPVDELTALLNEAQKPLSDLTSVMSPMKQFIFSGPFLVPFFNSGKATLGDFGYKDPSLIAKQVTTTHEVSSDIEIYNNLIPAILLKALGETENACDPLWDYLCFFLKAPRQKKSLADGIIKTLPVLKKDWETAKKKPEDLKKAFKYTKEWFNSSFKDGAELPYSLLGLTANILGIAINKRHTLKEYTFTVVSRPIDTIAAINSIHLEYEGIKNLILKKAGDQAILELELKKEHKMKPKDAKELYESTCLALKDTYLPRGSTTSILYQLFSSSQIRNESDVTKIFAWDEDTTFTYKEGENGKTVFSLKFTSNNKIIINTSITRRDHAPD